MSTSVMLSPPATAAAAAPGSDATAAAAAAGRHDDADPTASSSDDCDDLTVPRRREIDAETIIAPVISRTQTSALYAVAAQADGARLPPEPLPVRGSATWTAPAGKRSKKQAQKLSFSLPSLQLPSLSGVSLSGFVNDWAVEREKEKEKEREKDKDKRKRARTLTLPEPMWSPGFFGRPSAPVDKRPPALRRASSASSLHRRLSHTSSLGDDAQFLHIHSMTNSRLKAIKDNLLAGLPTLPQLPYLQQQLASFNPFSDAELPGPAVPRDGSPALEALDNVVGDVVVLGGYRGSILREKAAGNRRVWIPLKVGLNLRKIDLEVGLDPEDEERMADKIQADGMLTHIGPVDISRRLLRRLRNGAAERGRRVHEWGYDWRLSPALLTARLIAFLEQLPCNRTGSKRKGALVIAHSLGGLIVRSAVNQRPELFSGVLYAGTPTHCVNILGPLRNGDSVLLNSKVFTAQVNFTLRSSYVFLPEDGHCFVDRNTGEPIPLDFFDAGTWQALGLSPCVSDLPPPPPASTSTLPRLPIPSPLKSSASSASPASPSSSTSHSHFSEPRDRTLAPQLRTPPNTSDAPASTLPKPAAVSYLSRTLAATLSFKRSLHFRPDLADAYPPMAVLYSKTTPTVRGARVAGRAGIARADVYDDLVFGAGDGVCLARAAMLPEGYRAVVKVSVDRGHVSLLGELEGVGRCVAGLVRERGW